MLHELTNIKAGHIMYCNEYNNSRKLVCMGVLFFIIRLIPEFYIHTQNDQFTLLTHRYGYFLLVHLVYIVKIIGVIRQ